MGKKKFYRRKRLWIPLILTIAVFLPFIFNPLLSFRWSVNSALRLFGIREHQLRADRYRFHYYEGGTEHPETVILLHGFGGNAMLSWMQLMPTLAKRYHVIAPDLLASNFLALNPKTYSVETEKKLILQLMDALHIPKASFIGLSVGGWISLILALDHPERVDKLILVESAGVTTEIPELAHLTLENREKTKRFMNLLFYYPPPLPGFVLDQLIKSSAHIRPRYEAVFMGFIDNSRKFLLDDKLGGIRRPTLILHGREDRVIPLEVGERLHRLIPGSQLLILEKSGHGAVWDSPWQLKKAVMNFLQQAPGPESAPANPTPISTSPAAPAGPPAPGR